MVLSIWESIIVPREGVVYFKPQNALASQPVPFRLIKTLQLKDETILIHNGGKK